MRAVDSVSLSRVSLGTDGQLADKRRARPSAKERRDFRVNEESALASKPVGVLFGLVFQERRGRRHVPSFGAFYRLTQ